MYTSKTEVAALGNVFRDERRESSPPTPQELIAALRRIHDACAQGHHERPKNTLGREEFMNAVREARAVLERTNSYRREEFYLPEAP